MESSQVIIDPYPQLETSPHHAYIERLQQPFIKFMYSETLRVERLYGDEYGLEPIPYEDVPPIETEEGRALHQAADEIVDSMFLSELGFVESGIDEIRQATSEHPGCDIKFIRDLDGTISARMTPDPVGDEESPFILRLGHAIQFEGLCADYGLHTKRIMPGARTVNDVICSTRRDWNIKKVIDAIEASYPAGEGEIVDRRLSVSTHRDADNYERNLTFEQACKIISLLNPALPSLDTPEDSELREFMNVIMNGLAVPDGFSDAGQAATIGVVKAFLQSLDIWSREKIPAIANIVYDAESTNTVFIYYDDGPTPSLLEHPRLYTVQLQLRGDGVDSRFRALDDPELISGGLRSRQILAIIKHRYQLDSGVK